MKRLILLVALFTSSITQADCQKITYISDFDDTIKTYRSAFPLFKLGNALWKKNVNAGMPELFKGLSNQYQDCGQKLDIYILTASLKLFRPSINSFFKHYQFPEYNLIVRPIIERTLEYKKSRLKYLISKSENPVILIGDDTSYDAVAYQWAKETFPKKVLQVYIHNVKDIKPEGNEIKYFSTWEIALNEFVSGRLRLENTLSVGNKVLNAPMKDIIPKYGKCPEELQDKKIQNLDLNKLNREINKKITNHCNPK